MCEENLGHRHFALQIMRIVCRDKILKYSNTRFAERYDAFERRLRPTMIYDLLDRREINDDV